MTETIALNNISERKPLKFVKRKGMMLHIIALVFVLGGVVGFMRLFDLSEFTYKLLQFGSIAAQFFLIVQAFWYSYRVSYTNKMVEVVTERFKRKSIISFKTMKEVKLNNELLVVNL